MSRKPIEFFIDEKGCHICISHTRNTKGYPHLKINGKVINISRFLWEQVNGFIPEGIHLLHRCDTPACINIEHFFLGTNQDNINDKIFKDRQSKGETNGRHKLTEEQVLQIRKELGSQEFIAKKYGVSRREI